MENPDPFVEPAALFRGLSSRRCLDEVVDLKAVFAGIFENGKALAACVLLCGRDPEIVLAQEPIRVILINDLGSRSEGEVCAVATRLSVGRSLSLV